MAEGQVPPQEAQEAPAEGGSGGGISDAIVSTDKSLSQITQAVTSNGQLPDEVKQAFASALDGWRNAVEGLMQVAGGGQEQAEGEAQGPAGGAVTPEQGGSGAVPMSHQMMRGK